MINIPTNYLSSKKYLWKFPNEMNQRKFDNLCLEHIKSSKKFDLIAAFGLRTCVILNRNLDTLQRYLDSNKDEIFYCSDFFTNNGKVFLCIAGESGIIKILDIEKGILDGFLKGHMGAIRSIKTFDNYLLSCGDDGCIRLWCLHRMMCIAVFGGILGHKDRVCSLDISYDQEFLITTGTDCTIKQWNLKSHINQYLIDKEYIFNYSPFLTFSETHKIPVLKVRFYGNLIVSLCNNIISVVYNNANKNMVQKNFNLRKNDPILIGNLELYDTCKTFIIVGHTLLCLSITGQIFISDLRNITDGNAPFIMETRIESIEDISYADGYIYTSTGETIHRILADLSRFN